MDNTIRPKAEIERLEKSISRISQLISSIQNLIEIESERSLPSEGRIIALQNSINHFKELKSKDEAKLQALVSVHSTIQMI